ncbi:hypothetical protein ACE6H2_007102 [Prunus campanulata]
MMQLSPSDHDNPENGIYAVNTQCSVDRLPLESCTKLHDYTSIPDISSNFAMNKIMKLRWSKPSCRHCEEKGKACRSKISEYSLAHVQTAESECLDFPEGIQYVSNKRLVTLAETHGAGVPPSCVSKDIFPAKSMTFEGITDCQKAEYMKGKSRSNLSVNRIE